MGVVAVDAGSVCAHVFAVYERDLQAGGIMAFVAEAVCGSGGLWIKIIPDYPRASAMLRRRCGMGGVRTAA